MMACLILAESSEVDMRLGDALMQLGRLDEAEEVRRERGIVAREGAVSGILGREGGQG